MTATEEMAYLEVYFMNCRFAGRCRSSERIDRQRGDRPKKAVTTGDSRDDAPCSTKLAAAGFDCAGRQQGARLLGTNGSN
jgi:hypothetical protein